MWDCRKRKDDILIKAVECCPRELESIAASAIEFLCGAQQIFEPGFPRYSQVADLSFS